MSVVFLSLQLYIKIIQNASQVSDKVHEPLLIIQRCLQSQLFQFGKSCQKLASASLSDNCREHKLCELHFGIFHLDAKQLPLKTSGADKVCSLHGDIHRIFQIQTPTTVGLLVGGIYTR